MVGRLVLFYGISALEDYLMPNPIYTYILYIYDLITDILSEKNFKRTRAYFFVHRLMVSIIAI